jgi:hypothetical protein
MNDKSSEFIQRLTSAQEISPAMRASYKAELETMLEPKITKRQALLGIAMVAGMVVTTGLLVRNMFIYDEKPLVYLSWATLAVAFSVAAWLIGRDLWRGKRSAKSAYSIVHVLTFAAGTMTTATLLIGLFAPDKPESMFNAFFLFVFYFACSESALHTRIAATELAAREQMLRIECRLADLSERLSAAER